MVIVGGLGVQVRPDLQRGTVNPDDAVRRGILIRRRGLRGDPPAASPPRRRWWPGPRGGPTRRLLAAFVGAGLVASALVAVPAAAAPKQPPRMPGAPSAAKVPRPAPARATGDSRPTWPAPGKAVVHDVRPPAAGTATVAVG